MVMKVVGLRYPRALARAAWKRPFSPSRRALERERDKPLLGMQRYLKMLSEGARLKFIYSDGKSGVSGSTSHGGFDNDVHTLNAIMKTILGKNPPQMFTTDEMEGY